jgi:hypothetical protein
LSSLKQNRHFAPFFDAHQIDARIIDFTKTGLNYGSARTKMLRVMKFGKFKPYILSKYPTEISLNETSSLEGASSKGV